MGQEVMNRKASMSVNIFIALWFAGIGGHIAEAGWLRDGVVLTREVMVVVWLSGVIVKDMFRRRSGKNDV